MSDHIRELSAELDEIFMNMEEDLWLEIEILKLEMYRNIKDVTYGTGYIEIRG